MSLYNDDGPVGSMWENQPAIEESPIEWNNYLTLEKLIALWRGKETISHCAAVGRVMSKSHLSHFASDQRNQRYPFNFSFAIADCSASVSVTVWNSLVPRYFRNLKIGDTVALTGFRIKRAFSSNDRVEFSLNPSNPTGIISYLTSSFFVFRFSFFVFRFSFFVFRFSFFVFRFAVFAHSSRRGSRACEQHRACARMEFQRHQIAFAFA
jgi:hypothetical protein